MSSIITLVMEVFYILFSFLCLTINKIHGIEKTYLDIFTFKVFLAVGILTILSEIVYINFQIKLIVVLQMILPILSLIIVYKKDNDFKESEKVAKYLQDI